MLARQRQRCVHLFLLCSLVLRIMDSRDPDARGGSIMDDSSEMRAMAIETVDQTDDVECSYPGKNGRSATWLSLPTFSTLSYSDLVSYFGVRGIALLLLLKIAGVVAFGYLLLGVGGTDPPGDYSTISLATGRPNDLREIIRRASSGAVNAERKALYTLQTTSDLVYDNYIEVARLHQNLRDVPF
jgi:hypothetical protein